MEFLQQILAYLCAPLVLFSGLVGLRGGVNETQYKEYKNVILLIGDGMGENHLELAKDKTPGDLVMEDQARMPIRGQSQTNSWPGFIVTDSAAGGTALACGIRNISGQIGVFALDPKMWIATPASVAELAIENGRLAGVVTTDSTSGATPAAFSAHTASRNGEAEISNGQLTSGLTLIWGAGSASVTEAKAKENDFAYFIKTETEMDALPAGSRSFGQFSGGDLGNLTNENDTPTLAEMTGKAIAILDNENGFFLMVEGAHIDKHAHSNKTDETVAHVRAFDDAIAEALAFAEADGETLVLVTADHETGGVKLQSGAYVFTSGGHTMANVPVFVNVTDAGFVGGGVWKNRQIGVQLGRVMGFGPDVFPTPILPRLGA